MKVKGLKWQYWKLEDWNEKNWKLEGQFCIFAYLLSDKHALKNDKKILLLNIV